MYGLRRSGLFFHSTAKKTILSRHSVNGYYRHASRFFTPQQSHPHTKLSALPLLKTVISATARRRAQLNIGNVALVCVQHFLDTSTPLLEAFIEIGIPSEQIFTLGKSYSNCSHVIEGVKKLGVHHIPNSKQVFIGKATTAFRRDNVTLWNMVQERLDNNRIKKIIILDHGGYSMAYAPYEILHPNWITSIEHTRFGLFNEELGVFSSPMILLADSAVKNHLEASLIAEEITQAVKTIIGDNPSASIYGIEGYGHIGQAIANACVSQGRTVIIYDKDASKLMDITETDNCRVTSDIDVLFDLLSQRENAILFGASGSDFTASPQVLEKLEAMKRPLKLVSCSSTDIEFNTLLCNYQSQYKDRDALQVFKDLTYINRCGVPLSIFNGGFPANFNRRKEILPPKDIQITRALQLCSVIQAAEMLERPDLLKNPQRYTLDPNLQSIIATQWLSEQPPGRFHEDVARHFQDLAWIEEHSGGAPYEALNGTQSTPESYCDSHDGYLSQNLT